MALIELGSPELLLLAPLFITLTLIGHYFAQRLKRSLEVFHYPPVKRLSRVVVKKGVRRSAWRGISLALKLVIIVLITFSLANPSIISYSEVSEKVEVPMVQEKDLAGQIMLAVDVSPSMGLRDVYPSRVEAAKNILAEFVKNSSDNVRFGVIAFDFRVIESLALTDDKNSIVSAIENITASESLPCLEEYTDIGFGLQMSLDPLAPFSSSNKTSAVILVSDGFVNYGRPDPLKSVFQATTRANSTGIPVYALHIGRMGQDSNDELMKQIADATEGKFMDSTSSEELKDVFNVIGKYYVPTHEWNSLVEIKTTIPVRVALGVWLMFVAAGFVVALWIGNYRHYRTSF